MLRLGTVCAVLLNVCMSIAPWPMFRRSATHDAATSRSGPASNSTAWIIKTSGPVYSSPVIGNNVVFVATYGSATGTLYALDPSDGSARWQFRAGGPIGSTPCVIEKLRQIIFGADDGFMYSVDMDTGMQVWRFRHTWFRKYVIASSPVYSESRDGTQRLFFGTSDSHGDIVALLLNGKDKPSVLWTLPTDGGLLSGVPGGCAYDNDEIFVGSNNGDVYAIGAIDGKVRWRSSTHGAVYSSPALSLDGKMIFVGSNDGNFYSLNRSSGKILWTLSTAGWVDSSPAVPAGSSVYIATSNGNGVRNYAAIYKIDGRTGSELWRHDLSDTEIGLYDPVVAGSRVYAGSVSKEGERSSGGYMWAWDVVSGAPLWRIDTHGHVGTAAAIGAEGEMYFGDRLGWVYKLPGPSQEPLFA